MFETGTTLKKVRKLRNLTLDQLASRSGIDRGTINRIELGHVSPRIDTIASLCEALDTTLAQFFAHAPFHSADPRTAGEASRRFQDSALQSLEFQPPDPPVAPDSYWPVPLSVWQGMVEAVARFEAMLSNSSELIIVLDERGTILYASPGAENLLARKRSDLQGRNFLDLVPEVERATVATALARPDPLTRMRPVTVTLHLGTPQDAWVALDCSLTSYLQSPSIRAVILNGTPVLG